MNLPLLALICIPFAAGLLVIFPGRFSRIIRWTVSLLGVLGSAASLFFLFWTKNNQGFNVWSLIKTSSFFQFSPTPSGLVIASMFLFLYLFFVLYSIGFFKKSQEADTEYQALSLFMLGSALGILFTSDLIFIYFFWEIAAITAWRLIGFHRSEEKITAATRMLIINFIGSALMLIGFLILALGPDQAGITFNLGDMTGLQLPVTAGIFILAGIFAKSAVIPLYIWVPSAYAESPTPVVALLAGMVENLGLVVFLKVFVETFTITPAWQTSILGVALASSLVAGGAALVVKDYRRILGYSTVSQLAFVLAGLAVVSGTGKGPGLAGALLFIVAHGLGKAALLLGYGLVERDLGDRNVMDTGKLAVRFPILFAGIIIASLSVIGLPPLLGFFAKLDVIFGVLSGSGIVLASGFILASLVTLLYMLRLFSSTFLVGKRPEERSPQSAYLSILVLLISLALLAGSILIKPLVAYLGG